MADLSGRPFVDALNSSFPHFLLLLQCVPHLKSFDEIDNIAAHAMAPPELTRGQSSVDRQGCTDDVGSFVRANEHGRVGNLFGGAHALGRNMCLEEICFVSFVCAKWLNIPVSTGPGPTMLTRTPVPASSMAADFVIPSTACLLPT